MFTRKSALLALSTISLIAPVGVANGQTPFSTVNVSVSASGAPSTVTGYQIDATCTNLANTTPATQTATASFPAAGTGTVPMMFMFTPQSNCVFKVNVAGTGAAATPALTVGGVNRPLTLTGSSWLSVPIPVTASTAVNAKFMYPSLTVKKVVEGTETTPGFDYRFETICTDNGTALQPVNGAGYAGTFTLKAGTQRVITQADYAGLRSTSECQVKETVNGSAASTSYSSANLDGTGMSTSTGSHRATTDGRTVTVTNRFVGDMIISKVVTGDPGSNIGIFEFNVTCDKSGPKETFLLKDRQSKTYQGLVVGSVCKVTETRSGNAQVSYADNSGNPTDGVVTISSVSCIDPALTSVPDCRANVIVTNKFAPTPVTTTVPVPTVVASNSQDPIVFVEPAPVTPVVVVEPTYTG